LGQPEEAQRVLAGFVDRFGDQSQLRVRYWAVRPEDTAHIHEGYRKAGLIDLIAQIVRRRRDIGVGKGPLRVVYPTEPIQTGIANGRGRPNRALGKLHRGLGWDHFDLADRLLAPYDRNEGADRGKEQHRAEEDCRRAGMGRHEKRH
jgi:hypothetical protein